LKDKILYQFIISSVLILVGCFLLIAGLFIPPIGIIDNSVLIAFGEILTFVGALFGIDYRYKYQIFMADKKKDKENTSVEQ
jgi:hypothetical protein